MKMNSNKHVPRGGVYRVRIGRKFKPVQIDYIEFNAACDRFLESRGLPVNSLPDHTNFGGIGVPKSKRKY